MKSSHEISRFGNEASRKLYRAAAEIAQKLEKQLSIVSNFTELFSTELTSLRMRLKDCCERLIFTDAIEYGKKAEDLLWRKVFYDFFHKCKQNRKALLESEYHRNALKSHLLAGIGTYHHILLRIQTEFHINLEGKVDIPFLWHLKGVKKERWKRYQQSAANDGSLKTWANQACHRILIYLGDLERYIAELHEPENTHLAERYYQQAYCIFPQNGTPHNQLGSLYNNRFDSAYHYMRCLACLEKFEGTEGNLLRVFDKNNEVLQQLNSADNCEKESHKCSRFLSKFLKLCQIFYFSSGENSQTYCQDVLQDFDNYIFINNLPKTSNGIKSPYLSDDVIFKVVVMAMLCVMKLNDKGDPDVSTAIAFSLALFSHVVNGATKRLMSTIFDKKPEIEDNLMENNTLKCEISISKEQLSDASGETDTNKDSFSKKSSCKKYNFKKFSINHLRALRRRRKMSSTSQEDSELSDGELIELPESDDECGLLNSDISQTGSCSSDSLSENEEEILLTENHNCNETKCKQDLILETTSELDGSTKGSLTDVPNNSTIIKDEDNHENEICQNSLLPPEKLISILKKNGLLPSLKILADWLRTNKEILSACAESSQFLLSRLIEFLNILLKIEEKLLHLKEDFSSLKRTEESWQQDYPLPEDTLLQEISVLKDVHSHLIFDVSKRRKLSSSSQVFLRIQCLLSFGRSLMQASESSVDFDTEKNKYYLNLSTKMKERIENIADSQETTNEIADDSESQKQKLMRSMAHLWLKAEVNDLEMLVEGSSRPQLSPYLVTDTSVLCYNLSLLKQLINAKRFIVVVPLVVIANLDQLKKETIGAREAIRWLESELRKGCRYIRAQRQMEKISLVPMKYPKKKEKEAWDFFQILECCNYLVQQQTNGKTSCSLVTLLVGSHHHLPDNASALSRSIDVSIENLGFFFSKWRNSMKNPG